MLLETTSPTSLTVLTQNIRMDTGAPSGDPDSWQDRRHVLADLLRRADADVIGTQEVLFSQLPVLDEVLAPTHQRLGHGREGGSRGEHNLLWLRRERVEVLAWDQVWLSEEPTRIGSLGWDGHCPRILVWARVRDLAVDREMVLATTHLDHAGAQAQEQGALLVHDRLREAADGAPIVLTGDFNVPAGIGGTWHRLIEAGLQDTHDVAAERLGEDFGTFPDYAEPRTGGERIDWILASGLEVAAHSVHAHSIDGVHASDHAAVMARLAW